MKSLLRYLAFALMVGGACAQSNLPACPSFGVFNNCFGTLEAPNGDKYVGEFKDGKRNGQGAIASANGSKFIGEFKEGKLASTANGQMIIFSAGAGQQALDKLGPNDKEKNGLFTRVFIKEMQKSGVSIDRVVRNVRTQVVDLAKSVKHDQVPAIYDQVIGEFYFKP